MSIPISTLNLFDEIISATKIIRDSMLFRDIEQIITNIRQKLTEIENSFGSFEEVRYKLNEADTLNKIAKWEVSRLECTFEGTKRALNLTKQTALNNMIIHGVSFGYSLYNLAQNGNILTLGNIFVAGSFAVIGIFNIKAYVITKERIIDLLHRNEDLREKSDIITGLGNQIIAIRQQRAQP